MAKNDKISNNATEINNRLKNGDIFFTGKNKAECSRCEAVVDADIDNYCWKCGYKLINKMEGNMKKFYSIKEKIIYGENDEVVICIELNNIPRDSKINLKDLIDDGVKEILGRIFQSNPEPSS